MTLGRGFPGWQFALGVLLVLGGCEDRRAPDLTQASTAHPEIVADLREDLTRERHPSDGGGRAWLEGGSGTEATAATSGEPGKWAIVFETGPEGIADGGWILFQVSPFWDWSTPQVVEEELPGFVEVSTGADGVVLQPATLDMQLLGIQVTGRGLEPGEQVRIVYGAGRLGAISDRYAERRSRFYIAVDGDGDGVREFVANQLWVDVDPGPPVLLVLTLPSTARPGDTVYLNAAILDRSASAVEHFSGELKLKASAEGLVTPPTLVFDEAAGAGLSTELLARDDGIYRVQAVGPNGLVAESNPLVVSEDAPRVLWADFHGHSNLSDGTGTPYDYFRYARDVAALDVVALTDHDHWGMEPLALHPEMWEEIRREAEVFHSPHRFVTLLGYEWTNWIYGHRHVLYFGDRGEVFDSIAPEFDTPDELWSALRGQQAITMAHHSAGGPVATDWSFLPDPELEPVTEIVSVHGSSEALDSPAVIYSAVPGNFVRDVLDRGVRFGLIGSGDSHDGHPGLAHLMASSGGLAALFSEELTREGVLQALRSRAVYATNGPRILLDVALGDWGMGEVVASGSVLPEPLEILVVAPRPLERIDVIRSGQVAVTIPGEGRREVPWVGTLEALEPGEYVYVRAVQIDGGAAWSSPIFFE